MMANVHTMLGITVRLQRKLYDWCRSHVQQGTLTLPEQLVPSPDLLRGSWRFPCLFLNLSTCRYFHIIQFLNLCHVYRDAVISTVMTVCYGLLNGLVIFSVIGVLAYETNVPINKVITSGMYDVGIVYNELNKCFVYICLKEIETSSIVIRKYHSIITSRRLCHA